MSVIVLDVQQGSIARRYRDRIGQTFGKLTLAGLPGKRAERRIVGVFRCACGKEREFSVGRVIAGYFAHCGCETNHVFNLQHGMRHSVEYRAWTHMKLRCLDPGNPQYRYYGAKGVGVQEEWVDSFVAFYEHVGPRPAGCSIDRIDTTGDYRPGNVRWATPKQQAENRRASWIVRVRGTSYPSLEEAGRANGVSATTIVRWCRSSKNGCVRRRRYT